MAESLLGKGLWEGEVSTEVRRGITQPGMAPPDALYVTFLDFFQQKWGELAGF